MTSATAADASAAAANALTVALIGFAGVLFAALLTLLTAMYNKWHERKENRSDKLAEAVETFETRCDELADEYARFFTEINHHGCYSTDLGSVTATGTPWSSVHRSVNAIERTVRRIARFDQALATKASAVHASLQQETVLAQGYPAVDALEREDYLTTWRQRTETSKQLRQSFSDAAAKRT